MVIMVFFFVFFLYEGTALENMHMLTIQATFIHLPAFVQSDLGLDYIQGCMPSLGIEPMTLVSNATVLNYRNAFKDIEESFAHLLT